MVNLELVYCRLVTGNKKKETVVAVSSSYNSLREYCKKEFKTVVKEAEHFTDDHYIIRESDIVIVRENLSRFNKN